MRYSYAVAACLLITATAQLSGCSVRAPENLAKVQVGTDNAGMAPTINTQLGERYDPQAEDDIGQQSISAWRTAVAHTKKPAGESDPDWQKQRALDESSAMAQLSKALKDHPSSSTIFLMMGQVEEHFGKNKDAAVYFRKATNMNTINSISLFKLAENERKAGELQSAEDHYRQLLKAQSDFYPATLGLAECLLQSDRAQAHQLAQQVVDAKPDDIKSLKRAQEIVSETKDGNLKR